jgi:hypothetical protein
MNISVIVDRLILDGISLPNTQRQILQSSVETELGRLLTENGLSVELIAGVAMPRVSAGSIHRNLDTGPTQMGQQIAQAVYRGIGWGSVNDPIDKQNG